MLLWRLPTALCTAHSDIGAVAAIPNAHNPLHRLYVFQREAEVCHVKYSLNIL